MDSPILTEALIRRLHQLARTPFTLAAFRARWREFGWSPRDADDHDPFGFHVSVPEAESLMVDPLGPRIVGASLPFYCWEDFSPGDHATREAYERQKQAYDEQFAAAARLAQAVLSPPVVNRTDSDEPAHRWMVWEGDHGVLILQQACFDPQFGVEINFWLSDCRAEAIRPGGGPLIDWLWERSQRAHDEGGFPPLPS